MAGYLGTKAVFLSTTAATVTGSSTVGAGLTVDNDGATVLTVDRAASDGMVLDVQKNGTSVGGISTVFDALHLNANADFGVKIASVSSGAFQYVAPVNQATSGSIVYDGQVNLGLSISRFKDLYLSGGVYLGGTGAANYLDDYEEGTWTPSVSSGFTLDSTQTAVYRKIGDVVHVFGSITVDVTSGTEAVLAGLPFNCGAGNEPVVITFNNASTYEYIPRARTSSSLPQLKFNPQVTANNVQIMIQATYRAS